MPQVGEVFSLVLESLTCFSVPLFSRGPFASSFFKGMGWRRKARYDPFAKDMVRCSLRAIKESHQRSAGKPGR